MKQIQHFIIDGNIQGESILIEDRNLVNQMLNVLRYVEGDQCVVLDGKGNKAKGTIGQINKRMVEIFLSEQEICNKSEQTIRLYIALSKKPATFELIVQKACELGVDEIISLVTNRTQVDYLRKPERLQLIMKESAEQCERCFVPKLKLPLKFSDFIKYPPEGLILAGDAWDFDLKLKDAEKNKILNIVIGPEGGLTKEELGEIRNVGGKIFSLGEYVLRMETAAISAISVVRFS